MPLPSDVSIRILTPGAANELFARNLAFFERHDIDLSAQIKTHRCESFKPCLNPDNSLNILDVAQRRLIYPSDKTGIETYHDALFANIEIIIDRHADFLMFGAESEFRRDYAPLQTQLQDDLFRHSHLPGLMDAETNDLKIDSEHITFLPLLRVYGLGLGEHLVRVINRYDINTLVIHEPNFDLFYCSLFNLPWDQIISHYQQSQHKHFQLNTGGLEESMENEQSLLQQMHPFFYCGRASISGFFDRDFQAYKDRSFDFDNRIFYLKASGFYDDQIRGFKHSMQNLQAGNIFYSGKALKKQYTVFLVGSGPSLSDAFTYIKKYQDHALIVACGSAIGALLKNGIQPDYHVLQERPFSVERLLQYADAQSYKNTSCLKLNVVSPEIDSLYSDSLIFQKINDPGSTLLPHGRFPVSSSVNPTVTNAGITMCKSLAAKQVLLFGIDYGTPEDNRQNHARDVPVFSANDGYTPIDHKEDIVDQHKTIRLEGNFGKTILANNYLHWSRNIANQALSEADAGNIQWINVGDGARLANTKAVKVSDLPKLRSPLDKKAAKKYIQSAFDNNYSLDDVKNTLLNIHVPTSEAFILAMMEAFQTIPATRNAMMSTIGIIVEAANTGSEELSYLPKKVFGVDIIRFLNVLYMQTLTTKTDAEATELYRNAIPVLNGHMEKIYADFVSLCAELLSPIDKTNEQSETIAI